MHIYIYMYIYIYIYVYIYTCIHGEISIVYVTHSRTDPWMGGMATHPYILIFVCIHKKKEGDAIHVYYSDPKHPINIHMYILTQQED